MECGRSNLFSLEVKFFAKMLAEEVNGIRGSKSNIQAEILP
jgi:hypothetical protein